jgi:hypothetical protein
VPAVVGEEALFGNTCSSVAHDRGGGVTLPSSATISSCTTWAARTAPLISARVSATHPSSSRAGMTTESFSGATRYVTILQRESR